MSLQFKAPTPQYSVEWMQHLIRTLMDHANGDQDIFHFRIWHREPDKVRRGMLVYADGVDWDPGGGGPSAGEGLYIYTSIGWTKLRNL